MNCWLFKTEPDAFSIDDLAAMPEQTEHWDGIRNYQVRNMLRDQIKIKDQVFIYHSSCKNVGIVGVAEVVKEGYVDHTQFDPHAKYYDAKSKPENPRWFMVDIKLIEKFSRLIPLSELKTLPALTDMRLLQKGNRLSIMQVAPDEWQLIHHLAQS